MTTPRMIQTHDRAVVPHRTDPIGLVLSVMLVLVIVGLACAAFLAVYTWTTPDAEEPVVLWTAGIFAATLLVAIAVPVYRRLRSRR